MDTPKYYSNQEIPASPSSEVSNCKVGEIEEINKNKDIIENQNSLEIFNPELLVNENNKTANINYINCEIDISNQKDHDDKLEIIRTNDSYLDCFIDNAVLNEHQVILETPMHEQTITSLEKENFTTYSNFEKFKRNNQDREESEKDDIKKVSRIILNNAPVLLKSIVDLLVRQKVQDFDTKEESKYDENLNIKIDKGNCNLKGGEEMLFTINSDVDNLVSSNKDVSVYCKFIDFYHSEMNVQTKFLYSLIDLDNESIKSHDFTSGSVCNMITFGVIKCNFDYVRELLINPETEKLFNSHIESIDIKSIYGDMYQTIVYSKCLKAMSLWYRKRSFDLVHYSFDYNGCFYIIERSIDTDSSGSFFSVNANVLAKILVIEPKTRKETYLKKFYVVDYAGDWSTNNQIIQMALKETELEYFGICNYIALNYKENRTYVEESKEKELRNILESILPVPIINEDYRK